MTKDRFLKQLPNLLLALAVLYFVMQRLPSIVEMTKRQGTVLADRDQVITLSGERLDIPLAGKKQVLVFWATWCGPCKVELARIQSLVEKGSIPVDAAVAISVGEKREVVEAFAKERGYSFTVALDESAAVANKFRVAGTPTILLVREDGAIDWMTVGVSPSLEFRVKRFFL